MRCCSACPPPCSRHWPKCRWAASAGIEVVLCCCTVQQSPAAPTKLAALPAPPHGMQCSAACSHCCTHATLALLHTFCCAGVLLPVGPQPARLPHRLCLARLPAHDGLPLQVRPACFSGAVSAALSVLFDLPGCWAVCFKSLHCTASHCLPPAATCLPLPLPHRRPLPCPSCCPCSEVVGRNCRFLQGPGTDPAAVQQLREALAAQPPRPVTVTLLNYRKDGRPFWNSLHVCPLRDAGGGSVCGWAVGAGASDCILPPTRCASGVRCGGGCPNNPPALGSCLSSAAHCLTHRLPTNLRLQMGGCSSLRACRWR